VSEQNKQNKTDMLTFERLPHEIYELSRKADAILKKLDENPRKPERTIVPGEHIETKFDITRQTLGRWRKSGRIPYIQVGGVIRYDLDKVIEALENKKRKSK
jgi:hypothetical protein